MSTSTPLLNCERESFSLSQFSGGVVLETYCPGDLIKTSLWTDRYTCIAYQMCYLGLLIQSLGEKNSSLANDLMSQFNAVVNEFTSLPEPQSGQPVLHDYFNALVDYINMAYNVLNTFLSNELNTSLDSVPGSSGLIIAVNTLSKKKIMDLMRSWDWNMVTQALQSIDQVLSYIKQTIILPTIMGQVSIVYTQTSTSMGTPSIKIVYTKTSTSMSTSVNRVDYRQISTSMRTSAGVSAKT